MQHTINVALQILPLQTNAYIPIIDAAIGCIQTSGLSYQVCPFETVIEGKYDEVMALIKKVQTICYEAGAIELIVNIKIHRCLDKDVHIKEKIQSYL